MPIARDVSTGSSTSVDKEVLAALRAIKAPTVDTTAHRNPVPSVVRGPEREANLDAALLQRAAEPRPAPAFDPVPAFGTSMNLLSGELGMKAGALTTVPEVEKYEPSADVKAGRISVSEGDSSSAISEIAAEARAKGIKGRGVQAYIHERTGMPGTDNYMQKMVAPEEDVADVEARGRRTQKNALNLGGNRRRTEELTSEEYKELSPRRKAAVDVNTLLITAIRDDLKSKTAISDKAGGKEYDAMVAEMFGEKNAETATFAPATMAVLQDIGFEAGGSQLDDVLKLKVGLTAEDIDDLGAAQRGSKDASLLTPEKARDDLTSALVSAFTKQRKDPQRGAKLLETQRNVLNTREQFDFGSEANNALVEQVYEYLANPENKGRMQPVMAEAKKTLSEEHWPMFLAFLDVRSREAIQFDNPLGMNPETDYMKPKRFRSRLGL